MLSLIKNEKYMSYYFLNYHSYTKALLIMDSPATIARAYCRRKNCIRRAKKWTRVELSALCRIWWMHCHHVGEKGTLHLFREECREHCIDSNRTDGAILTKIEDCYYLYNNIPLRCTYLFRTVFDEIKRELGDA